MGTLGYKYILCGYMEPLGRVPQGNLGPRQAPTGRVPFRFLERVLGSEIGWPTDYWLRVSGFQGKEVRGLGWLC